MSYVTWETSSHVALPRCVQSVVWRRPLGSPRIANRACEWAAMWRCIVEPYYRGMSACLTGYDDHRLPACLIGT
jgi:hypothetical protein